jgi:LysM repeat protein
MKSITITALCLMVSANIFASNYFSADTLVNQSKTYVIHQVKADETLYSLLKKYQCNADQVYAANPDMKSSSSIFVNQKIKFPRTTTSSSSSTIISSRSSSEAAKENAVNTHQTSTIHVVMANETLYSLSRRYDVAIDQLKNLNHISGNEVKVGQSLIIRNLDSSIKSDEHISAENKFPDNKKPTEFSVPNANSGEKVSELGVAEVITTDKHSRKMLALHRTAPLGSLLTVKNEATGDRVVVKVIGKLPDTGNNANVLVRLSPNAFYKLNPKDIRIRAEVAYFLPPSI